MKGYNRIEQIQGWEMLWPCVFVLQFPSISQGLRRPEQSQNEIQGIWSIPLQLRKIKKLQHNDRYHRSVSQSVSQSVTRTRRVSNRIIKTSSYHHALLPNSPPTRRQETKIHSRTYHNVYHLPCPRYPSTYIRRRDKQPPLCPQRAIVPATFIHVV